MKTTTDLQWCIQRLCALAGQREGDRAMEELETLLEGQDLTGQAQEDCLEQLARASSIRTKKEMAGDAPGDLDDFELFDEPPNRLPLLIRAATLVVEHGVNPLLDADIIMHRSHRQWGGAMIEAIIAAEHAGKPLRTVLGETVLHRLAANCMDMWQQPDYTWPDGWVNLGRTSDGATPLHLAWSLSEGGPHRTLEAENPNHPMSWMGYEYQEQTIFVSRYLVEKGARWEDVDHEGVSAAMRMLQAYDAGVGEWRPNVMGVDWIDGPLSYWTAVRHAHRLNEVLPVPNDATADKPARF